MFHFEYDFISIRIRISNQLNCLLAVLRKKKKRKNQFRDSFFGSKTKKKYSRFQFKSNRSISFQKLTLHISNHFETSLTSPCRHSSLSLSRSEIFRDSLFKNRIFFFARISNCWFNSTDTRWQMVKKFQKKYKQNYDRDPKLKLQKNPTSV